MPIAPGFDQIADRIEADEKEQKLAPKSKPVMSLARLQGPKESSPPYRQRLVLCTASVDSHRATRCYPDRGERTELTENGIGEFYFHSEQSG